MNVETLRGGPAAAAIWGHRLGVVPWRVEPRDALLALVDDLADGGARAFEVTFDGVSATADVVALREHLRGGDYDRCLVGSGTIHRRDQLGAPPRTGVAPLFDPGVVRAAVDGGLPFPRGADPTEIAAAWDAGATFVKLFPASAGWPSSLRELRGPLPEIRLVPKGGIDRTNAGAFLEAGAAAVGIGGAVFGATSEQHRALVGATATGTGA